MALEMNDLMMLKGLDDKGGLTPYEQYKVGFMQAKKPSGVAIAGLTVASVAAAAGITAWIFGPLYGSAKANQAKEAAYGAKELAIAKNDGLRDLVQTLAATVAAERNERIAQGVTMTQTINDTISGQQSAAQSSQVSQTSAIDTSVQQIMTQTFADAVTGKSSLNPTPVTIYSAPAPCGCPGCGCNG